MKGLNIAVVGATGLVGRKMLEILEAYQINIDQLYLFSSKRSSGQIIVFNEKPYTVEELTEDSFNKPIDFALFSAGGDISKLYAPIAASKGITVIDNSSAWRMDETVPLVVPEVNFNVLKNHNHIIANPNCSTIQSVVPLAIIHELFQIKRIVYTTYQAVSGSGLKGINALGRGENQNFYPKQIDYNVIPQIDTFLDNHYTKEEQKMINETKKILGDDSLKITATCVRVPVVNGHSVAINVECQKPIDLDKLERAFKDAQGIKYFTQHDIITPKDVSGQDAVYVSRLRKDLSLENGLDLWVVADNIRKGAASNAVQILKKLTEEIQ